MKMADLPSRVVRPLGDWDDEESNIDTSGLTPLRARILGLVRRGVDTAMQVSRAAECTPQGALNALEALQRLGHVERVFDGQPNPRGGRPACKWVAA